MAYLKNGYWYRSVREGTHVRTEYIGSGERARFAADCDNERQQERTLDRVRLQALAIQEGCGDKAIDAIQEQLKVFTDNALTANGWHKVNGTWRKKRQ